VREGIRGNESDTRVDSTLIKSATADAETRLSREFLKADEAGLSARDTPQERLVFSNTQSANETTPKEVNQQYPIPSHSHAENRRPSRDQWCDIRSGYCESSLSRSLPDHQAPHIEEKPAPVTDLGRRDEINPSRFKRRTTRKGESRSPLRKTTRKSVSWSLDESRSAEPYTPPPKPHIGIETPVVNSKPHSTLTNSNIKIMIAKDVASQHTKLALHTIRTNAKEAKGGGGLLHRNVTNPARNEDQRHAEDKLRGE
jgi:hypothetical protein